MSEYEGRIVLKVPPDEALRFLSSVHNIPSFLPWIREIRSEFDDHVFAIAEEDGKRREIDGFFRVNEADRRIDWGSDGTLYSGWLEIRDAGEARSELHIHLSMEPGGHDELIRQTVAQTLDRIRRILEEQGGGKILGQERKVA